MATIFFQILRVIQKQTTEQRERDSVVPIYLNFVEASFIATLSLGNACIHHTAEK